MIFVIWLISWCITVPMFYTGIDPDETTKKRHVTGVHLVQLIFIILLGPIGLLAFLGRLAKFRIK